MQHLVMAVVWPAFLVAIVAEGLFFSLFDPLELSIVGGRHLALSAPAIYTIGFFSFWFCCSLAGLLTYLLVRPAPNPHVRLG